MGIVRDITVEELKQAVNNIDTSTLAQDSTLQAVVTAINNISGGTDPVTNTTVNTLGKDTTLQSIAAAISALGTALGSDKANIDGSNIANPSAFLSSLGFRELTITVTTGSTMVYSGYYHGDYNLSIYSSKVYSLTVIQTTSNRPAFVQLLSSGTLRVWTTEASTTVNVRVNYIN